jgi:hypothetical protein
MRASSKGVGKRESCGLWEKETALIVSEIVQSSRPGLGQPCVGTGASYRIIDHGARPDPHRHRMIVRRPAGRAYQSAAWTPGGRRSSCSLQGTSRRVRAAVAPLAIDRSVEEDEMGRRLVARELAGR